MRWKTRNLLKDGLESGSTVSIISKSCLCRSSFKGAFTEKTRIKMDFVSRALVKGLVWLRFICARC